MKKILYLVSLSLALLFFSATSFSLTTTTYVVVLPGYFYFTINGSLQEGVDLRGLVPANDAVSQLGYWNADKNFDYIYYYDSSSVPGFRIQMYLDGDFVYSGNHPEQTDISYSNFFVYAKWDSILKKGEVPNIGVDDFNATLNIDGGKSCKPTGDPYSNFYSFFVDFFVDDYGTSFVNMPFSYLISTNSCKNEGKLNIGRFQLNLGPVKAGEFKSSLYLVMFDGY